VCVSVSVDASVSESESESESEVRFRFWGPRFGFYGLGFQELNFRCYFRVQGVE